MKHRTPIGSSRLSLLIADADPDRRQAVKRWLVSSPEVNTTRLAETSSANVAFDLLTTRGADVAVVEASLKRTEDEFPAELGREIAETPNPPRLILYAHHYEPTHLVPGVEPMRFLLNAALAHGFVDLKRPDAPARLIEAVDSPGGPRLFLHT